MDAPVERPARDRLRYRRLAHDYLDSLRHTAEEPALIFWRSEFWLFEAGRWVRYPPSVLQYKVLSWLGEADIASDSKTAEEVTHNLAAITATVGPVRLNWWYPEVGAELSDAGHWLRTPSQLICPSRLAAGSPDGVRQSTRRWFSCAVLPYNYEPGVDCPRWKEDIHNWLDNDEERIALLQEFLGYWLVPDTTQHACLLLIGASGAGKSTILETVKMVLGDDNVSSLALSDFSKTFALTATEGRLLNVADETSDLMTRENEAILKWFISGSTINVDRKFLPRVDMPITARLAVGTNVWPRFKDSSGGIWRRLHVLPMNHVIPYEKKQVDYAKARFWQERAGILNWALDGLRRVRQQGRFTKPAASSSEMDLRRQLSQPHVQFVLEGLQAEATGFLPTAVLENAFKFYCLSNALKDTSDLFSLLQEIRQRFPQANVGARAYHNGKRCRGVAGVRLTATLPD